MKLKKNFNIESSVCRICKFFSSDFCQKEKYNRTWLKDEYTESLLNGITFLEIPGHYIVINCEHFKPEIFLSDYIPIFDKLK